MLIPPAALKTQTRPLFSAEAASAQMLPVSIGTREYFFVSVVVCHKAKIGQGWGSRWKKNRPNLEQTWIRVLDMITRWKNSFVRVVPQLVRCVLWHHKTRPQCIAKRTPSGCPMVKLKNLICPVVEEYEPPVWHWLPVGDTREIVKG